MDNYESKTLARSTFSIRSHFITMQSFIAAALTETVTQSSRHEKKIIVARHLHRDFTLFTNDAKNCSPINQHRNAKLFHNVASKGAIAFRQSAFS